MPQCENCTIVHEFKDIIEGLKAECKAQRTENRILIGTLILVTIGIKIASYFIA